MRISNVNYPVSQAVIHIINDRGLKQKSVAEKLGVSAQSFNDMLKGRRIIKAVEIERIAQVLQVEPNELFQHSNQKQDIGLKGGKENK